MRRLASSLLFVAITPFVASAQPPTSPTSPTSPTAPTSPTSPTAPTSPTRSSSAFQGTITYTAVEPDSAATTWTLATDGTTHRATLDGHKRFIGVEGRFAQRDEQFAVVEAPYEFAKVPSKPLPSRTIAGRAASCLQFVPTTLPSAGANGPDRFEACLFVDATVVPFSIFGGMADVDVDAAFAERGLRGLPASAASVGKQGPWSSWTATTIDKTPPTPMKKEAFLTFAPPLTAKQRCLQQIENGPRVVKAAAVALESYRAETDRYTLDLDAAGFSHSATALYAVKVESIEAGNFEIVADGLGEATGDQWKIDRSFRARHTKTASCR